MMAHGLVRLRQRLWSRVSAERLERVAESQREAIISQSCIACTRAVRESEIRLALRRKDPPTIAVDDARESPRSIKSQYVSVLPRLMLTGAKSAAGTAWASDSRSVRFGSRLPRRIAVDRTRRYRYVPTCLERPSNPSTLDADVEGRYLQRHGDAVAANADARDVRRRRREVGDEWRAGEADRVADIEGGVAEV